MKKIFIVVLTIVILCTASIAVYGFNKTTVLYNEKGETLTVKSYKADEYDGAGWYDAPVRIMYSADGRTICIYESETEVHEKAGWYTEPVTLLYAEDGSSSYIKQSEIEEYKNAGWSDERPSAEGLFELKDQISEYISARNGEWGVFVKSMATNEYLLINEKSYSSASLIKLFAMAALYSELENGNLSLNAELDESLTLMITESSNHALNYITRAIGGGDTVKGFELVNANTSAIGCTNTQHKSELIDKSGDYAICIGYNLTSPMDCGTLLEKIYKGTLVSKAASSQMLDLLKRQTRTWKIPAALPDGTVTANKTGENSKVEGDAAIVYSPCGDYVICVIGNGNVSSGVDTIQSVSKMTYEYFNS